MPEPESPPPTQPSQTISLDESVRSKIREEVERDFSEKFTKISEHARAEISWVRTAYKFAFGFIITGVTVLLGLGIYFTYQNTHDLKADMQKDADATQTNLRSDFETFKQKQQQDQSSYLQEMHEQVTKRIDAEFTSSNIVALVHDQAKERIDLIADVLIEKDITNRIAPLRVELLNALKVNGDKEQSQIDAVDKSLNESYNSESNLQVILTEAKIAQKRLDDQSDFIMTVLAAESDDRAAYEKITKLAADANYSLHDQASKTKDEIELKYVGTESETDKAWREIGWQPSVKPDTFDFTTIEIVWQGVASVYARAYIDFVWGHTNITKLQKINFLHDALADSRNSLKAEDKAAHILSDELKASYNPPFDFSDIEKKWPVWIKTNQPSASGTNISNSK